MKLKNIIPAVIGGAIVAVVMVAFAPSGDGVATNQESAYDRVMRTGTLRCAFGLWEPAVMRDPNTGEMSGLVYDMMQELGHILNIKVEYTLEVPWGSIAEALQSGKADAHCAGIFNSPARGKHMAFTKPLFFSPTVAFSRIDDERFDFNLDAINDPDVTVAISDDDITNEIYLRDFPKAKTYELPQLTAPEELFLAVQGRKADVTFNGPSRLQTYEEHNPGTIRIIPSTRPLRIFANGIAVDIHEQELLHVLNTAVENLHNNGTIDGVIRKYQKRYSTDFIVPVNKPYTWGDKK